MQCWPGAHSTNQPWVSHAGRHVEDGLGQDVGPSWVSHVDGSTYIGTFEIAFEAVWDSSLQCDCFGLLMRQWRILKGTSHVLWTPVHHVGALR